MAMADPFDVDIALDHHQESVESLYWYPDLGCIDSCTTKPIETQVNTGGGGGGGAEWPEFPMLQSCLSSPAHQGVDSTTLLESLLNDDGLEVPLLKHLPDSPHSVIEQHSLEMKAEEVDAGAEESMEEEDDDTGLDSLDFYSMESDCHITPPQDATSQEFIGCRLFHLLLAGAEAMFSQTLDLARVILFRLRELSSCSSTCPVFQRVAYYFTDGLQTLLDGTRIAKVVTSSSISYLDTLTAFQALHEASPYIKFGHYVANQAILESIGDEKRVHIVDYELSVGIQWPSLMQALAMREGGSPHLRITAIHRPYMKHHLASLQETRDRLMECAAAFKIPFSFHQARIEDDEEEVSKLVGLRLIKGEILIVNCMLHLLHVPHKSPASVVSFLNSVNRLSPRLVTFVEEEVMSVVDAASSVEKFFHALHHYSALLDSLEASLHETTAHILVERAFLATRIKTALIALASQRRPRQQHSQAENWSGLLQAAGFDRVPLSRRNVCQAKLLLGLFKDGYQLQESSVAETISLALSWKSKPLITASCWTCKNADGGELE